MNKVKIKEFLIDEDDIESGVKIISIVADPAIEVGYMKFADSVNCSFSVLNEEEQIFVGPSMIPDKLIKRKDESTGELFYGFFSRDTIKKLSQKYQIEGRQLQVNLEHMYSVDSIALVESWLINNPKNDKANDLGYDLPAGTWMTTFKVLDKQLWEELKKVNFTGFSIQGKFLVEDKTSDINNSSLDKNDELLIEIINILKNIE